MTDRSVAVPSVGSTFFSVSIALDAAHIRWHQAGGPDAESNGLALCVMHHKTFDLGAFTVADGVLLVSDLMNGTTGFQETLLAFHGKPVRLPQRPDWKPEPQHLIWAWARGVQGRGKAPGVNGGSSRRSGPADRKREYNDETEKRRELTSSSGSGRGCSDGYPG